MSPLQARAGARFRYVFDLGDQWEHECEVMENAAAVAQPYPPGPLPIWGWGTLPDQYGREDGDDFVLEAFE